MDKVNKRIKIKDLPIIISDGNYSAKYPKAEEMIDKGIPFIRSNNIKSNTVIWNDMKYISENKHSELLKGHIKTNDILISVRGDIGNVALVPEEFDDANINAQIALLRVKDKDIINPKYLLYSLKEKETIKQIERNQTGTALKQLPIGKLKEIEVLIQDINIQKKVVNVLDRVQKLIDKRKEQIQYLDELVKSQFIEMFGNLKDEEKLPLEKCTTFIDYRGKTPTLSESGIRIINAKSVGNGFFKYIDEYISEETYDSWMKRGFPVAGDVLFVTEGHTFGNVCRIPNDLKKFAMGQRVITMQGKGGLLNNIFLAQYMQSMVFKIDIDKYKTGSSAQGIRSKELQKILIPIPNIELQNKFADFVKQVDKLKFEMEKSLKELEDNFNSLMQKAFKEELFN